MHYCNITRFCAKIEATQLENQQAIESVYKTAKFSDLNSLKKMISEVSQKLDRLGYFEKTNTPLSKKNDSVFTLKYTLNKRFKEITILHPETTLPVEIIDQWSSNKSPHSFTVATNKLESILRALTEHYANEGFSFASVQLTNIANNNKKITATLTLKRKRYRRIDDIIIKGYEKFPEAFLKHYFKIKKNQTLSPTAIKEKLENFNTVSFASQLKDPEILFSKDSTKLYLYLKKENNNTFDGFLGFNSNETTNKIEFNGYLDLKLNNNLNYGEKLALEYRSTNNEQRSFSASIETPFIFNSPIGLLFNLNIFKQDSTFLSTEQSIKTSYQVSQKIKLLAGINRISSNALQDSILITGIENYESSFFTSAIKYNSKQQSIFNFKKTSVELAVKIGNRKTDTNKTKQVINKLLASQIIDLNHKNHILIKNTTFFINTDEILSNELYRFGGITSIRGFEEQSLEASFASIINTEYIYSISPSLYTNLIFDAAYTENAFTNTKEKLIGFGFGIGLKTNKNIFRLIFANGKTSSQNINLSNSKIHISLTTSF